MRRIQSALRYTEGGRYRFTLDADLIVDLRLHLRGFHVLQDRGRTFAVLDDDQLTIRKGFAFDGCSPAFRIAGRWFGVPTPPSAVAAAATHDCLRGYLRLPCLCYSIGDTDDVFHSILEEQGCKLGDLYHAAVAGWPGRLYYRLTALGPSSARCRCHCCTSPSGLPLLGRQIKLHA